MRLTRTGYFTDMQLAKNPDRDAILLRIKREGRLQQNLEWDIQYHVNGNIFNWKAVTK